MCTVLTFLSESEKLQSLFSESNNFASVIFCFDGFRRYKIEKSYLGVSKVQDLFLFSGTPLSGLSPHWNYFLYPQSSRLNCSMDSLCGKVRSIRGEFPSANECHVFINRSRKELKILYYIQGELSVLHKKLTQGTYKLKKEELQASFFSISWSRLNQLVLCPKPARKGIKLI